MNTAPQTVQETSPESPVSKFRSSPTEGAKGGNVRTATTLWLMSAGALVVSAFLGPLVFLGIALLVIGIVYHVLFMLELRRRRRALVAEGLIHGQSGFPPSMTLITAILLLLVGIVGIVSVLFRKGPFG